jgi:uncharacterized protein YggT (Ycf19 family)
MPDTPLSTPIADRRVRGAVDSDVVHAAISEAPVHGEGVRELGREIHQDAVSEARREHRVRRHRPALGRAMQVVNYLFGALYALIILEVALELLGARDANGFKHLLDQLTAPFLSPFRTLLPIFKTGPNELITGYLIALVVYFFLHLGLRRLAAMLAEPRPSL